MTRAIQPKKKPKIPVESRSLVFPHKLVFFFVYLNPRHCPHGLRLSEQQTVRFSKVKSRFLFLQERASQARTLGKIKRGTHLYRIKKASDGHVLPLSYHVLGYTLVTNFWLISFPNGRASKSLPILVKFE